MLLVQKRAFFQLFFSWEYSPGKCLLRYSRTKFKKSKKLTIFQGVNAWFLSKNGHFSYYFFLGNIGQESVFYDILEPKYTFLGYENTKFKKPKSWHFSKGVNQWRWSKNGDFSKKTFLSIIGQENIFYDILEPKNTFLGYKNEKFKKSKNWHFSKGLIFRTFFLRQ